MGRYLGIDYGTKRIGIAVSDGLGLTAQPLDVVARSEAVAHISELVSTYEVTKLIIGLPTALGGFEGSSAMAARELGEELAECTGVEVVYVDERFTSRMAETALVDSGMKRRRRRETVDMVAAAIILQAYLDHAPTDRNSDDGRDV